MNSLTITGNLGKDAELKYMQDGTPILAFSVADSQGRDKQPIWWDCAVFGKRADALAQYMKKGQQVTVVGSVSQREHDGKRYYSVRVNDLALQGGRQEVQQQQPARQQPAQRPQRQQQYQQPAGDGFDDMADDLIPF